MEPDFFVVVSLFCLLIAFLEAKRLSAPKPPPKCPCDSEAFLAAVLAQERRLTAQIDRLTKIPNPKRAKTDSQPKSPIGRGKLTR